MDDVAVVLAFVTDGGRLAVAGQDGGFIVEAKQAGMYAFHQLATAAAGHKRCSDAAPQKGIAREEIVLSHEADTARRMPRCVNDGQCHTAH